MSCLITTCRSGGEKAGHSAGNALLLMIMLLLGISLMMLSVLHRFYQTEWRNGQDETAFYRSDAGAASALEWGLTLVWSRKALNETQFYCRTAPDPELKSCLRRLRANKLLLQGSMFSPWFEQNITHYQLVSAREEGDNMILTALPQGWSDFCPPDLKPGCNRHTETGENNE